MDAEDWAYLKKFCLFALGGFVALSAIIMYFHSTAEPVTPSTSSKSSQIITNSYGNTDSAYAVTTKQQKATTTQSNASSSTSAGSNNSDSDGMFQIFLMLGMIGGIIAYIMRGGQPFYMRQPWQTF